MPRKLLRLTWADFDDAIAFIGNAAAGKVRAVYGQARGGLPLAVALSHRLGVPLVDCFGDGVLWVDDIVDTGATLVSAQSGDPDAMFAAWVQRGSHGVVAPIKLHGDDWVLFPWEQESFASQDQDQYHASRQ